MAGQMELQALLVLGGVALAGIAVLLLMGLFSNSGTSYEEAIAQQRKATTELLALAENKNKPKKNTKKANKKLAKKERNKENTPLATASEPESEAPAESGVEDEIPAPIKSHVEFSPPVVVDVLRDTPPNVKIRKRGKDPKVKPILINKEDPSCVSDPNSLPATAEPSFTNNFEELHPKDEFELLQSTLSAEKTPEKQEEVVEKKDGKPKVGKNAKTPKPAVPVDTAKDDVRERNNAGDGPKEQRKAKKVDKRAAVEEAVVEAVREEVVPPLNVPQPTELTTDKLLKQALGGAPAPAAAASSAPAPTSSPAASPPAGKNKKKKAEPNVLALMAGDSGGVNVGELVRIVREAVLSRTEIQILTDALLNKHHDPLPEHSEWTEGPNDPIQKLKKQLADKEKALADEVEASQALHAKLKELRAGLNAERGRAAATARAAEQAAAAARADAHALQARIQRLLDDNHALAQDKLMLQAKLGAEAEAQAQRVQMEMHIQRLSEAEAGLLQQLGALQGELGARALEAGQARLEAAAARDALILAQQHAAELAQQLQEANRAFGELEQQRQCAAHADQLAQQELRQLQERLAAMTELQNEVQKQASRAQAAESAAGTIKEEAEKQKQQLSNDLASLREQLAEREAELAELKALKAAAPAQNGLPSSEQHKAAELSKVESVVEALRAELGAEQRAAREQREHVTRLADSLAQHQRKNNEAIEQALEAQYAEVASVLREAWPGAPDAGGRAGLQAFVVGLRAQLARNQPQPQPESESLQAQNKHLQALVDKYKRIIDDTEGVLSHLQQNVTKEEQRWAQQLADKQRELDELRQRTVLQMQNKIDTLQAELQQSRSSNHSFADAERLTEERLMAGLSEKLNVDLTNGPLQVGQ